MHTLYSRTMTNVLQPREIIGVDFSGAAKAGDQIWIARCRVVDGRLTVRSLDRLTDLCGTADRATAMAALGRMIVDSDAAWGIDFPFGLPIEMGYADWSDQLYAVKAWPGDAKSFGLRCVNTAKLLGGKLHIRRACDVDTPFDCYHYRIIYQTFHGMRDVLAPIRDRVCVLPFDVDRLRTDRAVVMEACPGSTLRRLKLPYNNYKQTAGATLDEKRRTTRRAILAGLRPLIDIPPPLIARTTRNLGGDALDAVIAAVGVARSFNTELLATIASCPRASLEGYVVA
jgi:hypothetical protein